MINKKHSKLILKRAFASFSLNCPNCGKDKLYKSYLKLKVKDNCANCGFDFSKFDVGDGASYFGICIVGLIVPILAIIVEINFEPSLITHLLLWTPTIIILTYLVLIYSKSLFIFVEHKVRELEKDKT